jgi:hypothetical protein
MALLQSNVLTLADWAKRLDPKGNVDTIVELLTQTNPILTDMRFMEGNLPTGHRMTQRTGLPTVFWRMINQGVPPSKSQTAQIDEGVGMMEAWSEVDVKLANLNADVNAFRFSEARAFIEAMNNEMASTLFYGNSGLAPEEFTGLAPRYSDLSAGNAANIIDAGGTGSDNTSAWLVVWGENTVFGLFPKGSKAGLVQRDHGEKIVEVSGGIGGNRMLAYLSSFHWDAGLGLRDWRYVVRVANIDVSDLDGGSPADVTELMIRAEHRIPSMGMGRAVWYVSRSVFEALDIQGRRDVEGGGGLSYDTIDGQRRRTFRGIPIESVDAILNTEERVV